MRIPKVTNMTSPRTGEPVANQYIIRTDKAEIFQSYNTIIAIKKMVSNKPNNSYYHEVIVLDKNDWNYSVTTSKYRNEFLGENTQETRRKIASGEYKLAELN